MWALSGNTEMMAAVVGIKLQRQVRVGETRTIKCGRERGRQLPIFVTVLETQIKPAERPELSHVPKKKDPRERGRQQPEWLTLSPLSQYLSSLNRLVSAKMRWVPSADSATPFVYLCVCVCARNEKGTSNTRCEPPADCVIPPRVYLNVKVCEHACV